MTEGEWDACTKPNQMLDVLRDAGVEGERRLRLLAVACCRRGWHALEDGRVRSAVELAERYADDPALAGEFARLDDPASIRRGGVNVPYLGRRDAHDAAAGVSLWLANTVSGRSKPMGYTDPAWLAERAAHAGLLRDIFGSPIRPLTPLSPSLLGWENGLVVKLAEAAYDHRSFPSGHLDPGRLAVLSDALEEAGCDNADILSHLRGSGPHVRGCHVLDLLLSKE